MEDGRQGSPERLYVALPLRVLQQDVEKTSGQQVDARAGARRDGNGLVCLVDVPLDQIV